MTKATNNPVKNDKPNVFNSEDHLFLFGYMDGFSDRLLRIELLVDLGLNFELSYSTFESEKITKQGKLPEDIRTEVLELIELDLSLLKESYGIHQGATDFPFYTMMINQYGENWKYSIGVIPVMSNGPTDEEQVFFKTILTLRNFLMNKTGYEIN